MYISGCQLLNDLLQACVKQMVKSVTFSTLLSLLDCSSSLFISLALLSSSCIITFHSHLSYPLRNQNIHQADNNSLKSRPSTKIADGSKASNETHKPPSPSGCVRPFSLYARKKHKKAARVAASCESERPRARTSASVTLSLAYLHVTPSILLREGKQLSCTLASTDMCK